jgi:hypothetical protein
MKPCWDTSPHRCHLGRHLLPDLTADPDGQSTAQRFIGGLLVLALLLLAGLVPQ